MLMTKCNYFPVRISITNLANLFVVKLKIGRFFLVIAALLSLSFEDKSNASDLKTKEFCFIRNLSEGGLPSYAILLLDVEPSTLEYEFVEPGDCENVDSQISMHEIEIVKSKIKETGTKIAFKKSVPFVNQEEDLLLSIGFARSFFLDPASEYFDQGKRVCGVEEIQELMGLYKKMQTDKIGCSSKFDVYYGNIEKNNEFLKITCPRDDKYCVFTIFYQNWEVWVSGVPKVALPRWQDVRVSLLSEIEISLNPRSKILKCDEQVCR